MVYVLILIQYYSIIILVTENIMRRQNLTRQEMIEQIAEDRWADFENENYGSWVVIEADPSVVIKGICKKLDTLTDEQIHEEWNKLECFNQQFKKHI